MQCRDCADVVRGEASVEDEIYWETRAKRNQNTDNASKEANDQAFGHENPSYVCLAGSASPENPNLFGPLDYGDIGNDRSHN